MDQLISQKLERLLLVNSSELIRANLLPLLSRPMFYGFDGRSSFWDHFLFHKWFALQICRHFCDTVLIFCRMFQAKFRFSNLKTIFKANTFMHKYLSYRLLILVLSLVETYPNKNKSYIFVIQNHCYIQKFVTFPSITYHLERV